MSRLVGKLIAVLIRLIADVVDFLKIADPTSLRSITWKFSNDPEDGAKLLILVCRKRGIVRAREMAEEMIAQANDSLLAATMSWLEIQFGQGVEALKKWIEQAKKIQAKRQELLLSLELYLSERSLEYDAAEIIEAILARNDLPMDFSRHALLEKAKLFLQAHQWDRASQLADRILDLEELPFARWIKWVDATDAFLLSMTALGWFYVGDITQTMKLMHQAENTGAKFEYISNQLTKLANSDEYQNSKEKNLK